MNTYTFLIIALVQILQVSESGNDSLFQYIQQNYDQGEITQVANLTAPDLDEAQITGEPLIWSFIYIARANLYREDYQKARRILRIEISPRLPESFSIIHLDAYSLKALLFKKLAREFPARSYLDSARISYCKLVGIIPDSLAGFKAGAYNNYANVFWEMGYPTEYLANQHEALKYAKAANDNDRISRAYRNIAEYYEKIDIDYDRAIELRKIAVKYGKQGEKLETNLSNQIRKAEQLRDAKGEYDQALNMLKETTQKARTAGLLEVAALSNMAYMRTQVMVQDHQQYLKTRYNRMIVVAILILIIGGFSWYRYLYPREEEIRSVLLKD